MSKRMSKLVGKLHYNWKGGNSTSYNNRDRDLPTRPKPEQCEVCGAFGKDLKKGLCYDHNHKTGKFRGWICGRCNFALGLVKDSKDILNMLIDYLDKNNI